MSAVHAIAWGLIEIDGQNFTRWKREVRKEMRAHRIALRYMGWEQFRLESRGKKGGHRVRAFLGRGTLAECCKIVSDRLAKNKSVAETHG